ncbi:hypothetical protein AB0N17_41170 [Streptomyces sp. NPDC051133]|uniref:hypothetical protein n=1 Tax=Streptomyces sp. NPDC051133 TaxID=3155521 RepID=UPI0034368D04
MQARKTASTADRHSCIPPVGAPRWATQRTPSPLIGDRGLLVCAVRTASGDGSRPIPGSGAELPATYIHHCHLLEHEDADLIRASIE